MEFTVGEKVDVLENGELVTELTGEVMEVTDDTVLIRPIHKTIPQELQEMFFSDMRIPHNLDGTAKDQEENPGYSIKKRD